MKRKIYQVMNGNGETVKSKIYNYSMYFFILISIIPLFFKQTNEHFILIDKITAIIFIIDYIFRLATANIHYNSNSVKSYLKYPLSFFAIIDLLSILPSLTYIFPGLQVLRILRIFKTFRSLKILRFSKSFNLILEVIKKEKQLLGTVFSLTFGYILLSALVMFQVEPDNFNNFFDAIYWSITTLTTVGYGDICPETEYGRIISIISSFVGIAVVALPTGIVTASFTSDLLRKEKKKKNKEHHK